METSQSRLWPTEGGNALLSIHWELIFKILCVFRQFDYSPEFTPFSMQCFISNNTNDLSLWLHFLTLTKILLHEIKHMLCVNEVIPRKTLEYDDSNGFIVLDAERQYKVCTNLRSNFGVSKSSLRRFFICFKRKFFFLNQINICKIISISLDLIN